MTTSRAEVTRALASWIASMRSTALPAEVRHHARRALLDHLAAAVPGAATPPASAVQQLLRETEGTGAATVVGTDLCLSAANAALANGTAAHALEVDDGFTPGSFHPGAPIISAVLSVAETRGVSGDDLLRAVAVGYEVGCRIAEVGHPGTWSRGFHNTPLAGVFGAAAGVATLLEVDGEVTASALGVAGSHASGLFEFLHDGTEVKRLHAGKAARDGVLSVELARRGLTGPASVLEGAQGYFSAYTDGDRDPTAVVQDLGTRWTMLGTYSKPHACCRHLHGPIDAVLALAAEHPIDLAAVTSIGVDTYATATRHAPCRATTVLDAQMSIPYAVAVALVAGEVGVAQFDEDVRRDARVLELAGKVCVQVSETCERDYPRMRPAEVTVRTRSGERSLRIDQPLGEPSNPLSDADLDAKFHRLCDPILGPQRAGLVVETVMTTADPATLSRHLRIPAPT